MTGTHKCTKCRRSYATAAALSQHLRDKHAGGAKRPARTNKRGPRRTTDVGPAVGGPTIYAPVTVVQSEDDRSTHFGVDRVAHIEDVSVFASGGVAVTIPVTAGAFSRLSVLAEAYQQIRYVQLDFKVASYASVNVGGGYITGFVKDPDDRPPSSTNARLNWLTAQPGSITTRWTQQATVRAKASDRWYYTSQGTEVREYSPGTFYLIVDSKATQAAALTVWAHWKVSFQKATVEPSTVKQLTAGVNLYTQNGHTGLFYKKGSVWKDDNDTMFPGWRMGMSLRLPAPLTIAVNVDNVVTTRIVWWLRFTSANDCLFCYETPTGASDEKAAAESLVLLAGTALEIQADNPDLVGEAPGRSPSSCADGQSACCSGANCSSDKVSKDLAGLISGLSALSTSLSSASLNLERLLLAQEASPSWGNSQLTPFQPASSGSFTMKQPLLGFPPLVRESPPPLVEDYSDLSDAP